MLTELLFFTLGVSLGMVVVLVVNHVFLWGKVKDHDETLKRLDGDIDNLYNYFEELNDKVKALETKTDYTSIAKAIIEKIKEE